MPNSIYPSVSESLRKVEKIIGKEKLNKLTTENPKKIIFDEEL